MPFFDLRSLFAGQTLPVGPYAIGNQALARNRPFAAVASFSAAIVEATNDRMRALALNKRGVARMQLGERTLAMADFFDAAEADPQVLSAIVNIGNLLLEDGAIDDAIAHYEAALRIDDDDATAHLNLSVAFRRLGKRAESVHHLRRSHRLEMRNAFRRRPQSQE